MTDSLTNKETSSASKAVFIKGLLHKIQPFSDCPPSDLHAVCENTVFDIERLGHLKHHQIGSSKRPHGLNN